MTVGERDAGAQRRSKSRKDPVFQLSPFMVLFGLSCAWIKLSRPPLRVMLLHDLRAACVRSRCTRMCRELI